jgi:drug/metabolite transporter (DMT)-like permease
MDKKKLWIIYVILSVILASINSYFFYKSGADGFWPVVLPVGVIIIFFSLWTFFYSITSLKNRLARITERITYIIHNFFLSILIKGVTIYIKLST